MIDDVRQREAEAFAAEKSGDFEHAIQIWEQILEAYPRWENGYAHYHLADCYTRTGQIDLAIESYQAAIVLTPNETMFSDALESLLEARKLGHI